MVDTYENEIAALLTTCRKIFGDDARWPVVAGYRSLALCVIDSIYSTGSHYNSVRNVVAHYVSYRNRQGANAYDDTLDDLLKTFQELAGSSKWADMVHNRKPASTKAGAVLKAEVIHRAATTLKSMGILSAIDLRRQLSTPEGMDELKQAWLRLPSQASGITFNYFLILAGYQSVKPDRMVIRFVEENMTLSVKKLGAKKIGEIISRVAYEYPT